MRYQEPLPPEYGRLDQTELCRRIAAHRRAFGPDLVILGHHYQRDAVFQFADFTGDSLKLSQQAAASRARFIVFCGVHFMAESADILTAGRCAVILPDLSAGCTMAEMADADDVTEALERIVAVCASESPAPAVVPITYVNSTAAVKALTGRWGGACCTSSNAVNVLAWGLRPTHDGGAGGRRVLALPDQHLGRNAAAALGYRLQDCVVYDPRQEGGGLSDDEIRAARFILWRGQCYVHQRFTVPQIEAVRRHVPGVRVIVHPECPQAVVQAADQAGSTEQIIRVITDSPAGSRWAVGTETNMVLRLARNNPDKLVRVLADTPPMCITMGRIDLPHLAWVLDELAAGRVVNRVQVPPETAADARVALERMLSIKATAGPMK